MRIRRAMCVPLVLHDPYFSIWSSTDHLYDADPVHWSGIRQQMRGYVTVDGVVYSFLGDKEFHDVIPQSYVDVTATATEYGFENEKIQLKVRFVSPLLLDDLILVSRPCTYVDIAVCKKTTCEVKVEFTVSDDLVQTQKSQLVGGNFERPATEEQPAFSYASMGKAAQRPLGNSGDNITIDWGYVYLASENDDTDLYYDEKNARIGSHMEFVDNGEKGLIIAYDDLLSVNYFGQWRKAYWTKQYATILDAVGAAFADRKEVCAKAAILDEDVEKKAFKVGGDEYAYLCCMSYRHAIGAHKLITDEDGQVLFLSKENDSGGFIGTVDVSYPSVPLFLLYSTEYIKGMLRPVFRFAASDAWEFDFAPHDLGRYPYAWGQAYGLKGQLNKKVFSGNHGEIYPPFYQYPKGSGLYDLRYQMPVEECGNMLIMTAAACILDGDASFAAPHMEVLGRWTEYLLTYGADPGEQLCTDDFAGHLSHNANLSVKAIMGIEAYSILLTMAGREQEASEYHTKAKEMASEWEKKAKADDHYVLAFGSVESWSLKYNLVWDKLFGSGLFSQSVYDQELAYYIKKTNTYGVPLDSRSGYTKSDWILWCAALTSDREVLDKLITPVAAYLENSPSRFPFSDWYETESGEYCHFKGRSVQGGIYMPLLRERFGNK